MNIETPLPMIEYYYIVKDILDKRVHNGRVEYLVEWMNSWEPDYRVYCPTLIAKFEHRKREEARMLTQLMQRGGIANVGDGRPLRECIPSSSRTIHIPEEVGEPEQFIDIIFRNGMAYFMMLWKGNNKVTLVPVGIANNVYPALVNKYLAGTDSD